jgi:hypothetical protein
MDINPLNLLSIGNILADVLVILDDQDQSQLTPGYYKAQVKLALDELGMDYSFLSVPLDVPMPSDLIIPMPVGCFNLKQIQVYIGTPTEVGYTTNVFWKKGRQTAGKNTGYTADSHGFNVTDPFFKVIEDDYSTYYFTVNNGSIYLSDSCESFDYVKLVYDGIPSKNLSEVRMIPPECRAAIVDWVTDRCAGSLKMRDARYRIIQIDAQRHLDEFGLNGSWHLAQDRLVRLDKKQLKDSIEYLSKLPE